MCESVPGPGSAPSLRATSRSVAEEATASAICVSAYLCQGFVRAKCAVPVPYSYVFFGRARRLPPLACTPSRRMSSAQDAESATAAAGTSRSVPGSLVYTRAPVPVPIRPFWCRMDERLGGGGQAVRGQASGRSSRSLISLATWPVAFTL